MFESFKKFGRKMALGAAIGSAAMSGESQASETPKAVSTDTQKEKSSGFKDNIVDQIQQMMKFPNDIKFHPSYTQAEKIQIMPDLMHKYLQISGRYQLINMNTIKDLDELHKNQEAFRNELGEYSRLVHGYETGTAEHLK